MSSHREAPEISKDPVADNTDTYAFVSPDKPGHGHDHHQLRPARGSARRAELLRVRRRRPLLDLHRQRRRRAAGHRVPVQVQDQAARTRTRSSTTPARSRPRQPELEPAPVLRRQPGQAHEGQHGTTGTSRSRRCSASDLACPPCNIGPRSTPNYDALADAGGAHGCTAARRCSPASATRGSSSTSGSIFDLGDLRPFQNLHLIADLAGDGRRRDRDAQRAHDRDPGPDQAASPATARCPTDPMAPRRCSASGARRAAARRG